MDFDRGRFARAWQRVCARRGPRRPETSLPGDGVRSLRVTERRCVVDSAQGQVPDRRGPRSLVPEAARRSRDRYFRPRLRVLDDVSPLRTMSPAMAANEAAIFPPRDAELYVERAQFGLPGKSF